jgi:hypothetical protein
VLVNLALLTLLLQTAAATPAATPTTVPAPAPTATPTPIRASFQPRTLQDIARDLRLKTGPDAKSGGSVIEVTPSSGKMPGAAPASSTAAAPSASPGPGEKTPTDNSSSFTEVRVVSVSSDGIVDPAGVVRVAGTIRNAGDRPVCSVSILVKIFDSRGTYLSSTQTAADVNILPVGETASFHASIQAPPGVRGARLNPDRRDVTEGSTSMGGDWRLLGDTEAKVVDATSCPK